MVFRGAELDNGGTVLEVLEDGGVEDFDAVVCAFAGLAVWEFFQPA